MARGNQSGSGAAGAAEHLRKGAANVREDVREMGGHLRDAAEAKYNELRDNAAEYYEEGRRRAHDVEERLEQMVREKPLTSLMIAAGVGAVLGFLWRRS